MDRVIFHVDVNSAFLSWSAVYRMEVLGEDTDLRQIPSVVAGDRQSRHGIVLAKSLPAKKFGIRTGEPLFLALEKCPTLAVEAPNYPLYVAASRRFVKLLRTFSPKVEQYSIDEAWVDMTGTERMLGTPLLAAEQMRRTIREQLGFTVNIGISSNKILAKMAGDLEKPDKILTLFPEEMERKMWPLPVRELFLVGAATEQRLTRLGIYTVGDLAHADPKMLRRRLGKQGETIWHFANGRNTDAVTPEPTQAQGYSNSVTLEQDVRTQEAAQQVLLGLCETVAARMRRDGLCGRCVCVRVRTNTFAQFSHRRSLHGATALTGVIFEAACGAFSELWDGETPLRQLGVQVTELSDEPYQQYDLFSGISPAQYERRLRLDETVDALREKFGEDIIQRAKFADAPQGFRAGGAGKAHRDGITKPLPADDPYGEN